MHRTGIFFHYEDGERLRDFPQALDGILDKNNVSFYDAFYPSKPPSSFDLEPIPEQWLHQVHTPDMVERVRATGAFEGALFSASGTVAAAIRIWRGEIDNAFVFTGYGDHHAGKDSFGGGCCLNGAAIAIQQLRRQFGARRLAIVDTDAHHGDGTWEIFEDDAEVLYVCFCARGRRDQNNKVNVQVPPRVDDDQYIGLAEEGFVSRARAFEPETIFWDWGYDGTQGDYGDIGLTPDAHIRLAQALQRAADDLCQGRLVVVLCGGRQRDLARRLIPQVISVLVGREPQDIPQRG
jgi:acetoin utilization deacetylase AcuC-like enzyme